MNNNQKVQFFRISGSFKKKKQLSNFSKEFCALTEEQAREKLFTELGSRNRLKRRQIRIDSILKITPQEVTNPFIQKLISTEFKIPYEE
ncbi:50S ribosomal protein L18Ae [Candidatus Hodarchaeum mangrovi]